MCICLTDCWLFGDGLIYINEKALLTRGPVMMIVVVVVGLVIGVVDLKEVEVNLLVAALKRHYDFGLSLVLDFALLVVVLVIEVCH